VLEALDLVVNILDRLRLIAADHRKQSKISVADQRLGFLLSQGRYNLLSRNEAQKSPDDNIIFHF
jgi:hypothetical protein